MFIFVNKSNCKSVPILINETLSKVTFHDQSTYMISIIYFLRVPTTDPM